MREMGDDRLGHAILRRLARRRSALTRRDAAAYRHRLLGTRDPENYLSYWAKNLYWFTCWEQTGYDKEVGYEGRAIALLPPGFEGFSLDESTVRTSDADRFWAAPQPAE